MIIYIYRHDDKNDFNIYEQRAVGTVSGDPKSLNKTKGVEHKCSSFTGQPSQSRRPGGARGCRGSRGVPGGEGRRADVGGP